MVATTDLHEHLALTRAKTLVAMQDNDADALIATSPANVQYLTGYRSFPHSLRKTNQTSVILTRDGERTLVLPSSDGDFVAMGGFEADNIRTNVKSSSS